MDSFESEAEARAFMRAAQRVAVGQTVGAAVNAYVDHLRSTPGGGGIVRRESTLKLVEWRLWGLLRREHEGLMLSEVTPSVARRLFAQRQGEVKTDTLLGELATVRRWAAYWVAERELRVDPFAGLQVCGERSAGKPQLRIDEARRFLGACLQEQSAPGDAVALTLLTGMRASEVTGLIVHDLDDGGRVLWVEDNLVRRLKTRKKRQLEVPTVLQPRLLQHAAGLPPEAQLWGTVDRHWLAYHVDRLCSAAGVPRVTPHGLRGTWATLARGAMPTEMVAAALGNRPEVSATSYIAPGAAMSADSTKVKDVLRADSDWVTTPDKPLPATPQPDDSTLN